jgi:hypothetical protein
VYVGVKKKEVTACFDLSHLKRVDTTTDFGRDPSLFEFKQQIFLALAD